MGTILEGADLWYAHLNGAHLEGAKLKGALDLPIGQLLQEKTLYGAKLDSSLIEQIERDYPHLLELPRPRNDK